MSTNYAPAPEVKEIAEQLIPLYHPHLSGARIEYVFTDKVTKRANKEVWGTMRKVSNLAAYLAGDQQSRQQGVTEEFFVMTITEPIWEDLEEDKREALVDHELCHAMLQIDKKGDPKLSILPHDLEEFTAIVKRHGLWREDVKRFAESAGHYEEEEDEEETKVDES